MAHAQKPGLVFQRNGRVHLNWRGDQFNRLLAAEVRASAVVMVVMLDTPYSEVECMNTGYPLHSHVSPSLPLPCVTVCHQVSTDLCNCSSSSSSSKRSCFQTISTHSHARFALNFTKINQQRKFLTTTERDRSHHRLY